MTNSTAKITKRDRYNAIIDVLTAANADADLVTFCKEQIELLDKKSAKAKETAAAKRAEADTLMDAVQEALGTVADGEYATINDVTDMVANGDEEITPAKVRYRLTKLVENGVAESADVKVPATDGGKARTIKGYRLVALAD